MANYNQISVVGYLGQDPETKYLKDGTAVATFSIASTFKNRDGDHTTWYRVSIFGKKAESVAQYLGKGSQAMVVGRHQIREYEDKNGQTKLSNEIVADSVVFLSFKEEGESRSAAPRQQRQRAASASRAAAVAEADEPVEIDDDDLPF